MNETRKMQNPGFYETQLSVIYHGIIINKLLQKNIIEIAESKTCNLRNPRMWLIVF